MANVVILGSGRSGTSAAAALFRHHPQLFFGYKTLQATVANPHGYYEDEIVNAINNILIRRMTGAALLDLVPLKHLHRAQKLFDPMHVDGRCGWLAAPRRMVPWRIGPTLAHLMTTLMRHQPFCFKDPRFCFTLQQWEPYLPQDTRKVLIFRDPSRTLDSMLRDSRELYQPSLPLTPAWAAKHWLRANESALRQREVSGAWMVVNCEDLLSGRATSALAAFTGLTVDPSHLQLSLQRSKATQPVDDACQSMYEKLCQIAAEDMARWSTQPAEVTATNEVDQHVETDWMKSSADKAVESRLP